jgi:predicted nucleic acid-binding protein
VTTFVIDASAVIELALNSERGQRVDDVISDASVVAPAHLDAEALSALGRLQRAGVLTDPQVAQQLAWLAAAPIVRVPLSDLLVGAWARRQNLHLNDALYAELAMTSGATLVTCDRGLAEQTLGAVLISD